MLAGSFACYCQTSVVGSSTWFHFKLILMVTASSSILNIELFLIPSSRCFIHSIYSMWILEHLMCWCLWLDCLNFNNILLTLLLSLHALPHLVDSSCCFLLLRWYLERLGHTHILLVSDFGTLESNIANLEYIWLCHFTKFRSIVDSCLAFIVLAYAALYVSVLSCLLHFIIMYEMVLLNVLACSEISLICLAQKHPVVTTACRCSCHFWDAGVIEWVCVGARVGIRILCAGMTAGACLSPELEKPNMLLGTTDTRHDAKRGVDH